MNSKTIYPTFWNSGPCFNCQGLKCWRRHACGIDILHTHRYYNLTLISEAWQFWVSVDLHSLHLPSSLCTVACSSAISHNERISMIANPLIPFCSMWLWPNWLPGPHLFQRWPMQLQARGWRPNMWWLLARPLQLHYRRLHSVRLFAVLKFRVLQRHYRTVPVSWGSSRTHMWHVLGGVLQPQLWWLPVMWLRHLW